MMEKIQDTIFLEGEGNNSFKRNDGHPPIKDHMLDILKLYNIHPSRVLDVGGSDGYQLAAWHDQLDFEGTVIEPSESAISEGQKRYPFLKFIRGTAENIPSPSHHYDLVMLDFVFHWIDRTTLLKSISEIDRVLCDDGYLLIWDFSPDNPTKVNYHHIKDNKVWTYKQNYAGIFTSTNLYSQIGYLSGHHETFEYNAKTKNYSRIGVNLLRKNYDKYS